jgi:ATP phosphoribosyltransferase regulatory subunit
VLHTRPGSAGVSREPLQVGAELFGHAGLEADLEVQRLMLALLQRFNLNGVYLDVGHVGIFRALVQRAGLDAEREMELFRALQGKDVPGLEELTAGMDAEIKSALLALPGLYGKRAVLEQAIQRLPKYPEIGAALDALQTLADELDRSGAEIYFDLAELRGYHYHSGVVFAAYVKDCPRAVAQGGRYDDVGKVFGRARSATGFSMDLRAIGGLLPDFDGKRGILAPYGEDAALQARIDALRAAGEVVVVELPGHEAHRAELNCNRRLTERDGGWDIESL